MAETPRQTFRVPGELIDAARVNLGCPDASASAVIREALARMAGTQAPTLRAGRPRTRIREVIA